MEQDIRIDEVCSTVHAVDNTSLLEPKTLRCIVNAVLEAVRAERAHQDRVNAEQNISGGVAREMEREWS